ncbi:CaiB/BaiF CoA transferase family protein [Streptomyces griseorubiginosus]|uniref:CaiB/BaiF CoA transferase family protein n=1 Tax=Streptomyces griseorubiginosus TaxID=67304 RepID=UPI001AD70837|nr:CoA transferase [Streptomyces griseorubiginosus]MBO4254540.1 CoA transferase [Streptomyces griseorubiginosus]
MTTPSALPLSGVLVADFGRVLAAPYATMLLADLGADVIKVEHPTTGDDTRAWGPPHAHGEATYYLSVNRNKRSLALDLRDERDRRRASELARRADVLFENFRPGTMHRHGLGYDQVRPGNPGLVYCSITGFGAGPGAGLPGYDLLIQAVGGLMSVTGPAPGRPVKTGVALVDVLTGLHAGIGVLAALRHRDATGEGQHIEVNLLSTLLSSLVNQAAGYTLAGQVPGILGNRHPSIAPYEVYRAKDRALVIAVGNDRQFAALCQGLDAPDLAADPRFATNPDRVAHVDELTRKLGELLATRTAAEWFEHLTPLGVPCGPVSDLGQAFDLAERLGLAPRAVVHADDGSPMDLVANPISLSRTPPRYARRPPRLGEHTGELAEWLDS